MDQLNLTTSVNLAVNEAHNRNAVLQMPSPDASLKSEASTVSIDNLSYFEQWSSAWVRHFIVQKVHSTKSDETEVPNGETVTPYLKLTIPDLSGDNVQALRNEYVLEENRNGAINTSMFRVCFSLCRNRLLVASGIYLMAILLGIISVTVFLFEVMSASKLLREITDHNHLDNKNQITQSETAGTTDYKDDQLLKNKIFYNTIIFVLFILAMLFLRCICRSMVSRVAIMLRSACVGAVYERCLMMSAQNYVPSYQAMVFCADDGDAIMEMVSKGSFIVAQIMGIALCLFCGFLTLGFHMLWMVVGTIILLTIAYIRAVASTTSYSKSQAFLKQKLAIIDNIIRMARSNKTIWNPDYYKNKFSSATSDQFWAIYRSNRMQPSFLAAIAMPFMILCMAFIAANLKSRFIASNTKQLLSLTIIFLYLVNTLLLEWSDAVMALLRGVATINRVKPFLVRIPEIVPISAPDDHSLKISINDATLKWNLPANGSLDMTKELTHVEEPGFSLNIPEFQVKQNSIVGITGDNVADLNSLVMAFLDKKPLERGQLFRSGAISYYPETPFMMEGCSIQQNVTFAPINDSNFNGQIYTEALSTVEMHLNPGCDLIPTIKGNMDQQLLHRISLARAIYEQCDNTILLENPLSSTESKELFANVIDKLLSLGKTVIVVSQDDNVLRHCQQIFLIIEGSLIEKRQTDTSTCYAYNHIVQDFRSKQDAWRLRNENNHSNVQTSLNISTEELLIVNEKPDTDGIPSSCIQFDRILLILLHGVNAFFQIVTPFIQLIFVFIFRFAIFYIIPITIVCAIVMIASHSIATFYVLRKSRRFDKRLQRSIFQQILRSPIVNVDISQIVASINVLLGSNATAFHLSSISIHYWLMVVIGTLVLSVQSFWYGLCALLMVVQFSVLFYMFRISMVNSGKMEMTRRQTLLENIHNEIEGRAVLQSLGRTGVSKKRIFELIDSHSADIYLSKSIIYYSQFIFTLCQVITLPAMMYALNHLYLKYEFAYMIGVLLLLLITNNINRLLEIRFEKIVADQKLQWTRDFKI